MMFEREQDEEGEYKRFYVSPNPETQASKGQDNVDDNKQTITKASRPSNNRTQEKDEDDVRMNEDKQSKANETRQV